MATTTTTTTDDTHFKREGDISDAFASLSGKAAQALPDRYRQIKQHLIAGHEADVVAGWTRLLAALRVENAVAAAEGPALIPEVRFDRLEEDLARSGDEIRKRGAAVVRGVIPEEEARAYKFEIEEYVRENPQTRGFPTDCPQVWELYWSAPQIRARSHPSMLKAQAALMTHLWHTSDASTPIALGTPLSYADRLRIRQPGDATFALGAHQDGGSVERWDPAGYGRGGVYGPVFAGQWERYDPFDATPRVGAVTDLHNGLGSCSAFRMFQGWLAMSRSGPGQGTLLVHPLLREATAYMLLRPFFRPVRTLAKLDGDRDRFLDAANWAFTPAEDMTSDLQGAVEGHGQELTEELHPHLELDRAMVHMPEVRPGDFVVWHCDGIHAVDKVHNGASDSSVLYIPVCPTTEENAKYMVRQRAAFLNGTPSPDFPGGKGESEHVGRLLKDDVARTTESPGLQAMGLARLVAPVDATVGASRVVEKANAILGF